MKGISLFRTSHYCTLCALLFLGLITACSVSPPDKTVGFVWDEAINHRELDSALSFLRSADYNVQVLPLTKLSADGVPHGVDILWYHRLDSTDITPLETSVGDEVKKFVTRGGSLMLSLDAVRLLNAWNIEPQKIDVAHADMVDEGFGRKAGFHAFRHHSVFEGLNGGAYIWHAKEDNTVRKLGFYDNQLPKGPDARIIGIDWAYITYHENAKLLWEYTLGKGHILAVGAYTYYAEPNFKRPHLEKFTRNCFNYLLNGPHEGDNFWTYEENDPRRIDNIVTPLKEFNHSSEKWNLPSSPERLNRPSATSDYYDLAGRRMLLMGEEKTGFNELWAHPFMAFRDYKVAVLQGETDPIWLNDLPCEVDFTPSHMIRTYKIGSSVIREVSAVSIDQPTAQIHYEINGDDVDHLLIKATTNLRLMWPYTSHATGTIEYQWSDKARLWVNRDKKTELLNALMGFSAKPVDKSIGKYKDIGYTSGQWQTEKTNMNQLVGAFLFEVEKNKMLDVILTAGEEETDSLFNDYAAIMNEPQREIKRSANYYKQLLQNQVAIETPDSTFNKGYTWALINTDQFMVETPGIGSSLVAGYGTTARGWNGFHEVSGRPGYAWYFGRDAQWSSFAMDAYGSFQNVKDVLKNFAKFQDLTGKIYHEITTSGSVHYDAADATPGYVILAAHYLKYSGDIDFINSLWPSIKKAMDYCYSTDHDGDGLIENTNVGHGWIEGGELYGAKTTFFLAGMWAKTLEEAAYIAKATGKSQLSDAYSKDYEHVKSLVNGSFFNKKTNFFNYSLEPDNSYNDEVTVLPAVPVLFGVVDDDKASIVSRRYGQNDFSTDWGVRILSQQSQLFSPGGYHYGSVWPLFAGWTSLTEYKYGQYAQGFMHIMNNLQAYKYWDLGSVDEVYHGLEYRPSGVCSDQCWSETMVLQPILEGMLGLKPDAPKNALTLTPAIPWNWSYITVKNIRVGENRITMKMEREKEETIFELIATGSNSQLNIELQPILPLFTKIRKVLVDGDTVGYTVYQTSQGLRLQIPAITVKNRSKVVIKHTGGIGVIPIIPEPQPGHVSEAFRVIDQRTNTKSYILTLEGRPGSQHEFEVYSSNPPMADGAELVKSSGSIYTFKVEFDQSKETYINQVVTLNVKKN